MTIELSVAIAVLIFAVLAVFVIITLLRVNKLLKDFEYKAKSLNPIVNAVSNLGNVCEKKTKDLNARCLSCNEEQLSDSSSYYPELATILLLSLKAGEKFLKNR